MMPTRDWSTALQSMIQMADVHAGLYSLPPTVLQRTEVQSS